MTISVKPAWRAFFFPYRVGRLTAQSARSSSHGIKSERSYATCITFTCRRRDIHFHLLQCPCQLPPCRYHLQNCSPRLARQDPPENENLELPEVADKDRWHTATLSRSHGARQVSSLRSHVPPCTTVPAWCWPCRSVTISQLILEMTIVEATVTPQRN